MRICIYGAGAIGGHLAVRYALAGEDVSVVARGPHLAAIRANGLAMEGGTDRHVVSVRATDDPAELGPQDAVIVAVKATGLAGIAAGLPPLLRPDTPVVFALNGIPWWYMAELDGRPGLAADAADQAVAAAVPRANAVGCVVYSANTVTAPGVIHNDRPGRDRYVFGDVEDAVSPACRALADSLGRGGATGIATDAIRPEIWRKLLSNIAIGPVSCLTGGTGKQVAGSEDLRPVCLAMVEETRAVARTYGIDVPFDPAAFRADRYSDHKSSILQDLELGRRLEIDAIPGAVQRLGQLKGVPTPMLDTVLALLRSRAGLLGLYP